MYASIDRARAAAPRGRRPLHPAPTHRRSARHSWRPRTAATGGRRSSAFWFRARWADATSVARHPRRTAARPRQGGARDTGPAACTSARARPGADRENRRRRRAGTGRCAPTRGRLNVWYSSQRFTMRSNESSGVRICTAPSMSSQKRSTAASAVSACNQVGITVCQLDRMRPVAAPVRGRTPRDATRRARCPTTSCRAPHGSRPAPVRPASCSRKSAAGALKRAVASDELATIAGVRSWCLRRSPERHTLAELRRCRCCAPAARRSRRPSP